MRLTKKQFVLAFFAVGYTLFFIMKFVLDWPPEALWPTADQAPWQRYASMLLSPFKLVLHAPITWLQQDPDPPPPFRHLLSAIYWTPLALGLHWLLLRKTTRA